MRFGDLALQVVAGAAALAVTVLVGLIIWKVIEGAWPAITKYGLALRQRVAWNPVLGHELYGAGSFLFGTAITSLVALVLAAPLAMGDRALPHRARAACLRAPGHGARRDARRDPERRASASGASSSSARLLRDHDRALAAQRVRLHPALRRAVGTGASIFTAIIVLTIMILPIVSSISRELFLGVPHDLKEGALALGTTRWEMVRGVMFPYARGGIAAALILGLGRALGEAIAVTQVIGGGVFIHWNLFGGGDTLASKIAASYQGSTTKLETASLIYLGADPARLLARS